MPPLASNWRESETCENSSQRDKVVAIAGIDTRKLTRILREKGAQAGCIMTGEKIDAAAAVHAAKKFPGLKGMDLAKVVSHQARLPVERGHAGQPENRPVMRAHQRLHVVAYDYGVKRNILRMLADRGCRMTVVPAQTPAEEVLALESGWRVPVERSRRSGAVRLRHRGHPRAGGGGHARPSASASATSCSAWPAARAP